MMSVYHQCYSHKAICSSFIVIMNTERIPRFSLRYGIDYERTLNCTWPKRENLVEKLLSSSVNFHRGVLINSKENRNSIINLPKLSDRKGNGIQAV